ncbi:MAG: hypothetical protein WC310_00605 [Patescibacteria group bacterium]|jgi:hypothetical protein
MKKTYMLWAVIMVVIAMFFSTAFAVDQPSNWIDQSLVGKRVAFCYQCLGLESRVDAGTKELKFTDAGYQLGEVFLVQSETIFIRMPAAVPGGVDVPDLSGQACGENRCLPVKTDKAARCLFLTNPEGSVADNDDAQVALAECWAETKRLIMESDQRLAADKTEEPVPLPEEKAATKTAKPYPSYLGLPQHANNWVMDDGLLPSPTSTKNMCAAGETPGVLGTGRHIKGGRVAQDDLDRRRVEAIAPPDWDGSWAIVPRTVVPGAVAAATWCLHQDELVGPGQATKVVAVSPPAAVKSPPAIPKVPPVMTGGGDGGGGDGNAKKIKFEKVLFDLPPGSEEWYFDVVENDAEVVVTMHVGKPTVSLWDNFKVSLRLEGGYGNYGSAYRPIKGWHKVDEQKLIDESGMFVPGFDADLILTHFLEIGAGATFLYASENPSTRQTGWGLLGNVRFYPFSWWEIRVGPFADFPGIARHSYWQNGARTANRYESSANIYGGYATMSWRLYAADRFAVFLSLPQGYLGQDENDEMRWRLGGGLHLRFGGPAAQ